ncbi:CPSF A subunit region-domain-containing protein [Suillus fuscotomentosus]|uniref:CPSF A subunit region-domain-containing protein n=1 Tax=Suillus fuscotomentosus TaxID=1912939 RepID=A0AAD4E1V3_9AGAM|nr:CPSF A subunit region-domain-containing protein [Suillus fuscotomentosus]KAG1898161.1 CPSF A subunit region-domain-containing protein [Suillus fuscotomentosus]
MKVVTTFHPASSVVDSLKFRLKDEHPSEFLVVAKSNRLDIYALLPEGLRHQQGLDIWGRVRVIRAVPVLSRSSISLLVLTDHPEPELIFLSFTVNGTGSTEITVTKYLSLSERSARPAEFCHTVLVDPSGGVAVVSAYTGKLKVVVLDQDGGYDHDFDASITELNLLDITFVSTSRDMYTLAMMHIDYQQRLQLLTRDLSIEDLQLSTLPSPLLPSLPVPGKLFSTAMDDDGTPTIIHIPSYKVDDDDFEGGILIIGGRKIMLYDFVDVETRAKRESKKKRADKKKTTGETEANAKEKGIEWKKRKARAAVEWPWAEVTAWCHVDDKRKYLIGDRYGKLALLSINLSGGTTLTLMALGETSAPTTLTYLANQVFYNGSHFGSSQLLQITTTPSFAFDAPTLPVPSTIPTISPNALNSHVSGRNTDASGYVVVGLGSYVTELESFSNLAPILDAVLIDTDGSGQNEIVTCSGGRSTGSIKVIRSGADFSEKAIVQGLGNVTHIWPLKVMYRAPDYAHIVVSTLQETHVFRFDNASSISSIDGDKNTGFITDLPTIAVSNILRRTYNAENKSDYADSSYVIQVISKGLLLLEYDPDVQQYTRIGEPWTLEKLADPGKEGLWKGREIVAASINASQVVLALNWGRVVLLTLDDKRFIKLRERNFVHNNRDAEISAVSCLPQDPAKRFALNIVVGFWTSKHVEILSLRAADGTMPTVTSSPVLPSAPRSLLLYNFTSDDSKFSNVHLLIGLTDGSIASFLYRNDQLLDQKLVSIGSLPVTMRSCRIGARQTVLACGSRTAILFWEKERLMYSPLILKDVTAAAELSTSDYPSSIVLANSDGLVFGNVNNFDKLHIRSIPLGLNNPLRITHIPALRVFAVACRYITPARIGDVEDINGSIQVFDDISFNKLGHFNLEQGEEPTSLLSFTTNSGSYLCVAAVTLEDEDTEASEGRIFILEMTSNALQVNMSVVTSYDVEGCPYALTSVNSMIAAAVNSMVIVFKMDTESGNMTMAQIATWNHNYLVTSLASRGDIILLGDAISSISMLRLEDNRLHLIARDYGPLWPTCVELMSNSTLIGANSEYNLYTFSLQDSGTRELLERDGNYFLGDLVNKFLPGTLSSQEVSLDSPMQPQQLFFTSAGLIGVIIDLADDLALDLTGLQRNLSNYIQKQEGPNHTKYRAPKNVRGRSDADASSFGFLDGDFLERFLQFVGTPQALKRIMDGQSEPEKLTISADRIQKVLESMQSMH